MTGPERETLTVLLETLREFREEVRGDIKGVNDLVHGLDQRVLAMEQKDAVAVAVAAAAQGIAAASNLRAEKRSIGLARAIGIAASIATVIGVAIGIAIQAFHI